MAEIQARYQTDDTPPPNRISTSVLRAPAEPAADTNHTSRELALVAVGALLLAIAFAVAAEPHRQDALVSTQMDPSVVWVPMVDGKVTTGSGTGNRN